MPPTATDQTSTLQPQRTSRLADLALVLPFILLFLVQLAHHALWRDELNAWGIAAASHSLRQLFYYVHYEGHPSLWYVLLWVVSRATDNPAAMKLLEACIGIAIYLLLALRSPFSRVEKALLYCSYFISFEYTVLSRMYGICLLLVLLYAAQRAAHPARVLLNALLLGLIANTDTLGILFSCALALEYALFIAAQQRRGLKLASRRRLVEGVLLFLGLLAASVLSLLPSKHISWRTTGHMFTFARSFGHLAQTCVDYVVLPWFPIATHFPHAFWNPSPVSHWKFFYAAMFPVVIAAYYALFRRERNLLALLLATACAGIAFGHLIYQGSMRQFGVMFMAFLVALWIQRGRIARVPTLVYVFLGLSALGGLQAAVAQWARPFSNAGNAARWIRDHGKENEPLIGQKDTNAIGVAEMLRRPMYQLECSCTDRFLLFSDRRDQYSEDQLPSRLARAMGDVHAPASVVRFHLCHDTIATARNPKPCARINALGTVHGCRSLAGRFLSL